MGTSHIVSLSVADAGADTMKGSIHVKVDYDDDKAYFLVRDTGEGIPQSGTVSSS